MTVTNSKYRDTLLRTKDPKEKLNIFALIRDLIGKDLSKFSVPGIYIDRFLKINNIYINSIS